MLLEGLEVAFIVLAFGSTQGRVGLAALAALTAVVLVTIVGVVVHGPLSRVPENTLKLSVGVLLTTFGTFWGTEGTGARWPGGDAALPVVLVAVVLASLVSVQVLRRRHAALVPAAR